MLWVYWHWGTWMASDGTIWLWGKTMDMIHYVPPFSSFLSLNCCGSKSASLHTSQAYVAHLYLGPLVCRQYRFSRWLRQWHVTHSISPAQHFRRQLCVLYLALRDRTNELCCSETESVTAQICSEPNLTQICAAFALRPTHGFDLSAHLTACFLTPPSVHPLH